MSRAFLTRSTETGRRFCLLHDAQSTSLSLPGRSHLPLPPPWVPRNKQHHSTQAMIPPLRRKPTLREPSSLCISPVYKSLKTKTMWRIGKEAQTESSFLYVFAPGPYDSRNLTCPFPLIIQTGLFSATVATFIALSYPNLQQDPNVTTQSILT